MGFNPFRPRNDSSTRDRNLVDLLMVAGAIVATLAMVAWAVFGR